MPPVEESARPAADAAWRHASLSPREFGAPPRGFRPRLALLLDTIKFRHSLFALPFALIAMLLAAGGVPGPWTVGWIVVACVAARSMAMAYNRLADRDLDALNPRTRRRALPAGLLTPRFVALFAGASAAVFVLSAAMLNPLCLVLSPLAIGVLLGYSHVKRFLHGSHFVLGLALALAPAGAWIAVRGSLEGLPLFLMLGVALWVAGFDILYACLDIAFDRGHGLRSIPARHGAGAGLKAAALLHGGCVAALALFFVSTGLGIAAWIALLITAVLLRLEHRLVRPDDLSRLGPAFFTTNAAVSLVLLAGCAIDILFL